MAAMWGAGWYESTAGGGGGEVGERTRSTTDERVRILPGTKTGFRVRAAENRRFGPLSALRAHTKPPYKNTFAVGNAEGA